MLFGGPEVFEDLVRSVSPFQPLELSFPLQRVQQHILLLPLSLQEVLAISDPLRQLLTGPRSPHELVLHVLARDILGADGHGQEGARSVS